MPLLKTALGLFVVVGVFALFVLTGYGIGKIVESVFGISEPLFEEFEAVAALGISAVLIIILIFLVLMLSFSVGNIIITA